MRIRRAVVNFLICLPIACTLGQALDATARQVTIAVVRDGQTPDGDIVPLIEHELSPLLQSGTEISFKSDPAFNAGWDPNRMTQVIRNALRDRQVDIILGVGALVTQAAARPDVDLAKPFVSAFVQRTDLFRIPYKQDGSLKKNLVFTLVPLGAERDIEQFKQMIGFETVHLVLGRELAEQLDFIAQGLAESEEALGVSIVPVPVDVDPSSALAQLDDGVQAVYLAATPRLSQEQRRSLIDAISAKNIPTFSGVGYADVEMGALAGLNPDLSRTLARRVALNLSQLMRGVPAGELPVVLNVKSKLFINARTAAAIGYAPQLQTRLFADFLYVEELASDAKPLTVTDALDIAEKSNASLAVKDADVDGALRDKQRARSPLLPQIGANGSYESHRRLFENPVWPEEISSAGLTVTQMIYDDELVSGFRSSGRRYNGAQLEREVERMNVLAQAAQAYMEFVLARVLQRVVGDNLRLTEDNLDLSKTRFEVGYSGRDEVFRWEAQVAQGMRDLLDSGAAEEEARIALNQVLGIDQGRLWIPEEIDIDPEVFSFLEGRVDPIVSTPDGFGRLREFLVQFAIENAPELEFFDAVIEAQNIQIGERKRRFLLPKFFADFDYNYFIDVSPGIPDARDDAWRVRVAAVYPIFNGGDRYYDVKRQQAALRGIESEKELTRQFVEQRARTALRRIESSFPGIKLSQMAADASKENLDVVQEKYAQGLVNVTDLLEAQNASFSADQGAAAAIYQFLIDVVQLQRSIAWFEEDKTPEERDEFIRRMEEAIFGN